MAYSDTWDSSFEATPAGSDSISVGDDDIRDLKLAVRERMQKDHYWDPAGTDGDHGEHKKVTFHEPISTPANVVDKGFLYTKDVSAKAELHWEDEDGNELQLTSGGKLKSVEVILTTQGDLLTHNGSGLSRVAVGSSGEVLTSDGTDPGWQEVPYPPGFLYGLELAKASDTEFEVSAGKARDSSDTVNGALSSTFTKSLSSWSAGSGGGSLDTGSIAADTWYHVFLIIKSDGTSDVLISTSLTSPTLPSGYSYKRRLGSLLMDGSAHITAFQQFGDDFYWDLPVVELETTSTGNSRQVLTITTPPGVECQAYMVSSYFRRKSDWDYWMWVGHPDKTDSAAGTDNHCHHTNSGDNATASSFVTCYTNTSSQIAYRYNTDTYGKILLQGYKDTRGRLG